MKTFFLSSTICIFFLLNVHTVQAISMGGIVGKVFQKENMKSVAYAEITFENNMERITVTANEYGYYYAEHLPTGRYQMRITYNDRTFFMNKVRVYDSYTSEINFMVSNNENLPITVELELKENLMSSVSSTNIKVSENAPGNMTRSLNETLSMQACVDVERGKVIVKGSNQVKFFVDGTQVMAPVSLSKGW
jgi:hypothetical protein